ncbi:MAG: aminoacyl-tRNA hydrolase [Christensenellaceae bacterium]|jgi:PTH1 family peptidyl-tRNA hydrolase|nr:aminoacyl-tRNA hydrolase [Christensenellaceae bacterium]
MYLIVGLGNPGGRYALTYHNIGFMAVDRVAERMGAQFTRERNSALVANAEYKGKKIILAKPKTYMNLSWQSVIAFVRKQHIPHQNVIILTDDIDIEKGTVRIRERGSGGTHNGLRGVVVSMGKEFRRIRIGSKPEGKVNLEKYVISNIDKQSFELISPAIDLAVQSVFDILDGRTEASVTIKVKPSLDT